MALDANYIHHILRNRLFDYSRRNKLLYFKSSLKHLDLRVASFPTHLGNQDDISQNIILVNKEMASKIIQGKEFSLSKYISSSDNSFVLSILNRIRLQSNKDIHEYGFNQLKLAIGFLDWFDLKGTVSEKISSPLILLPVDLVRKKGVQDDFMIRFTESEAEINPVLAGKLKDLYNIVLPVSVDLSVSAIISLHQSIKKQIELSSDVQLSLVDMPDVKRIIIESKQFHQKYNKPEKDISTTEDRITEEDPKLWGFDITRFVLGNFNYRKMSLVGDYDELMEKPFTHAVFSQLFGDLTKKNINQSEPLPLKEQFHVIQADSTQKNAVGMAHRNESYISQGPPGTGKSQTIVNLVADFVARGKKVLFVCEKRAAIDVVYFRLKQKKLDEFCTIIHDSQSDKKEFVMDLKKTSESYSEYTFETAEIEHKRNQIIYHIERELYSIRLFHAFMQQRLEKANIHVHELLNLVISTRGYISSVAFDEAQWPGYDQWKKYGSAIRQIATATKQSGHSFFAENPLSSLHESTYFLYDQSNQLKNDFSKAIDLLNEISENLSGVEIPENNKRLIDIRDFIQELSVIIPFHEVGRLDLLVDGSELKVQFEKAVQHIKEIEKKLTDALSKNNFWIEKLTPIDTENALDTIKKYESSFFSFLSRTYRRTRKSISKSYDFSRHQLRPTNKRVIQNLDEEYRLFHTFEQQKATYEQFFKLGDLKELETQLKEIYQSNHQSISYLREIQNERETIEKLKILDGLFRTLDKKIGNKIRLADDINIAEIIKSLEGIIHHLKDLSLFIPHLKELSSAEVSLKKLIKKERYTPQQIEALLAKSSINRFFQFNPEVMAIDGNILHNHIVKIEKLYDKFLHINSIYIRSKQRDRYGALIRESELSTAGKSEVQKEQKRILNEGHKILRKEFEKSMRYKSIRELASLESGRIIRELKPVWLMSPLSVSDTLPLQADYFDVVIFDEASQIALEEGIPSIYRAAQTIIVGDEMQMPPSHFFTHVSESESDGLNAESFLEQGSRKFPSMMLGWHYRSRHESLIAFSNAAFYGNHLSTIPNRLHFKNQLKPIIVEKNNEAVFNLWQALERPISYHYLKNGIYNDRTNINEAEYIAELVRELLRNGNNPSIGVVAFSKEQQREIEHAINRLSDNDKDFDDRLEDEYKRMEDGQFTGIFLKNLENIQGDERDIIIMSTCYGYGSNGKMTMNFGPINREGGEKRLNVIFSRAKRNMFVVSSIKHSDITNHHNTGSNYFRKYLQYAEAVSIGDIEEANRVIRNITTNIVIDDIIHPNIVLNELKSALENNGYIVIQNIGQSGFKCHLGVMKSLEGDFYVAGILLDDAYHYKNDDLLEQYIFKPQLLKSNGWNIIQIYSKDWYLDSENVLRQVIHQIENEVIESGINIASHIEMQPVKSLEIFSIRLEKRGEKSSKFWEIRKISSDLTIKSGRLNTSGKSMVKPFQNQQIAEKAMWKMIAIKLKNGYVRVN